MGRPRKPIEELELAGTMSPTALERRRAETKVVQSPGKPGVPTMPITLSDEAQLEWPLFVEKLRDRLCLDDDDALGELCEVQSLIRAAISAAQRGQTVNGKPNPAVRNLRTLTSLRDAALKRFEKRSANSAEMSDAEMFRVLDEMKAGKSNVQ